MFRNLKLQRAIAYSLILSLAGSPVLPVMAAQTMAAPLVVKLPPGWSPLTKIDLPGNARKGLLQLDAGGPAVGKSQGAAKAGVGASAASIDPYAQALWTLEESASGHGQPMTAAAALAQVNSVRAQYRTVMKAEADADAEFAATEARLRAAGLPAEIMQRHQTTVAAFAARKTELGKAMTGLDDAAAGKKSTASALLDIGQLFAHYPNHLLNKGAQGAQLPWGQRKVKAHQVAVTERQLERTFPRSVLLASNGSLSGITLPEAILGAAPLPGDLAETEEAPFTHDIRDLATKLSNNPVQIYNWVRNNVQYTVGYGSMQGAAGTLKSKRGNDADTASLLIALLRAGGIPARYAYGTIEVPAARVQSWLGVDNSAAAQTLLSSAGIPNKAVVQGGQTNSIQLEHMWVKAYVDFTPSRGAVNKAPGQWIELDPSFKLAKDKAGLDMRGAVSLNEAGVFDGFKAGAMCTPGAAQSVNVSNLQAEYAAYMSRLSNYLAQQGGDLTVGGMLGSSTSVLLNHEILLGTLPYKTIVSGAEANVLPEALRWQFRFQLFADQTAQGQGQATAALNANLASVATKRITLSFAPATQADADTLASFMPRAHTDGTPILAGEFPPSVPGYLIRVKAELRADGQLMASGGSFVLGSTLAGEVGMFDPASSSWNSTDIAARAGDYHALALDTQGVSAAQLDMVKARLATTQAALLTRPASLTRDDVSGDVLYQAALAFFATADSNSMAFQRAAGVVEQRLPSYGRAVAPVKPQMVLGIVSKVSFPGAQLAIDRLAGAVARNSGGLDVLAFVRQENERNSAYAHQVAAKMFGDAQRPATAVSAVKVLAAAASQGMPVFAVTAANIAAILPQLNLGPDALAQLQDNVAAGYRVLTPQTMVTAGDWSGYAMQIEDVASGAGAFVLIEELGNANAAIYPAHGMGWLALAQPFQSGAALAPALLAGQAIDSVLASNLNAANTRWSFFSGQTEVGNGLFLARIASLQGDMACDILVGIVAASLGTSGGFDQSGGVTGPPVFTSVPQVAGTAAQAYAYAAAATDPQALVLRWSLSEAPSGMVIGASGAITWAAPIAGEFYVTVRADNGRAYAEQRYLLTAGKEALPLEVSLAVEPAIVGQGESVTVTLLSNGGTGAITRTLKIDGAPVVLNGTGQAVVTGSVLGAHQILATATDQFGTQSKSGFYSVRNPGDTSAPTALITAPEADVEITAPVNVIGTASDANLAYYQLLLRPAGSQEWQEIARGTRSVAAGVLGKLDPTQLMNGIYELALNVVDANGQKGQSMVTLDIYRDLKIGQFSISFEDLNVEASGIPLRVTRTYDTRRKGESLDFGHGWSVDYQNVQLRKNIPTGVAWQIVTHASQLTICLVPTASHKVNITLPTGKVERFVTGNAQDCAVAQVPPLDIRFNALPGTTSTLEAVSDSHVESRGPELYDYDNLEPWNPHEFKLTTEDKYVYYITEGIGVTTIVDPAGNTLTYSRDGIIHSNGTSVAFTRDANNRITSVTDPAGKRINYGYLANGDLSSVTDRTDAVSKFTYNRSHGLLDYTDPRGIVTARYTYDADGRLIAVTDATGKAVEMTHDLSSNREVVKDRNGNTTTYTYDSAGNVTEIVDALQQKTRMQYDALGNETSVTNALQQTTLKSYDPATGKQLREEDPLHNVTSWSYDPVTKTRLKHAFDARQNSTSFYYGAAGESYAEPLGRTTNWHVDPRGNLDALNIAGQQSRFTSDSKGNRLTETDTLGNVTLFTYDDNGKEVSRSWTRFADGQPTTASATRKLDAEGRVLEETDALGFNTKTAYDAAGHVVSTTDPQGRQKKYEYDSRYKLAKTVYADGSFEAHTYDANGNTTYSTDRQGRVTRFEYDALNRLTTTTYPDGSSQGTLYDAAGRVTSTIDANQKATVNSYDDGGRLIKVTGPDDRSTRFAYDPNGNRTDIWDANEKHTQFEFDALNRLTGTTRPDGKKATTVWNVNGTKKAQTDFAGNAVSYGYDAMGRLNQVTETNLATAQVTVYGLDLLGNKTSQKDAEGRTTRWDYDVGNRVVSRTLPGGQKENFSYDAVGNRIGLTDFGGANTVYGYNDLYLPNLKALPDGGVITTAYTAGGQVDSISVKPGAGSGLQGGATRYIYDAQDRLTRQTNPDGSFLAYGYDANGQINQRSTSAGTIGYGYDDNGHLSKVTDSAGKVTSYTYDPSARLLSTAMPNGVTTTYRYDDNGRLLQVLDVKGTAIVTGVRYILADNGQRTKAEEFDGLSVLAVAGPGNPVVTRNYRYDGVGRLTQEQVLDRSNAVVRTTEYGYDKVGNRSSRSESTAGGTESIAYTYDSNDRLTQEMKTTTTGSHVATLYGWDANGNMVSKSVGSSSVTLYVWSAEGRLIEVKLGASTALAQTIARYTYDTMGNRVGRSEPAAGQADKVTTYLVDGTFDYPQTVQETVAHGEPAQQTSYVFGVGLLEQVYDGQAMYFHRDGLGSVKALTGADGESTNAYRYDGFGTVEYRTGTKENGYRHTGEYFDDRIGLQYNRARWLDTSVGRFVSQDKYPGTLTTPITLNKYVYAGADGVNKTDPSGYMSMMEVGAAEGVAGTLNSIEINFGANLGMAALDPMSAGGSIALDCAAILVPGSLGKVASFIGSAFTKSKLFKLGQGRSALAKNLVIFGSSKSGAQAAHHIVPYGENFASAQGAREILAKHRIDINSPLNGIWLDKTVHNGRHPRVYSNRIFDRLREADLNGGMAKVRSTLQELQTELRSGEWDAYL